MRSWKLDALLAAALLAWPGVAAAQEGPIRDSGPAVAKPRNPDSGGDSAEPDLPKIPSRLNKEAVPAGNLPTFKSNVDIVTLDVAVTDGKGHFIPKIPAGNFRILEDNVPQKITKVDLGEAPMTVALVIEFSNVFQRYWGPAWYQTLQLAWGFAASLKPEDYCAVVAYDIRPEILTDFTNDKEKIHEALGRLTYASWAEANLFDAISDTADRMSGIEGRKAIVLISSGVDTFSKMTYDQARKSLRESGVPIYSIGLMQALRIMAEANMGAITQMNFLQADNQMKTFATETGGQAFFPRFEGEFPSVFQTIQQALRSQYVISYSPSNKAHDGAFRQIKVELVNPATNEALVFKDEKGKPLKVQIIAKAGYKAPRAVE
ncbi:MAG: VWA domain-containing protein [Bryobacteraceae bacterium]|jgi:VWFA-related protein